MTDVIGEIPIAPGVHPSSCDCPMCDVFADEKKLFECHFCHSRVMKTTKPEYAEFFPYLLPKGWCHCVIYSGPSHEDWLCCRACKRHVKRNRDGIWEYQREDDPAELGL